MLSRLSYPHPHQYLVVYLRLLRAVGTLSPLFEGGFYDGALLCKWLVGNGFQEVAQTLRAEFGLVVAAAKLIGNAVGRHI